MGNYNHFVVSQKLCGFQGYVGGCVVVMEAVVVAPKVQSLSSITDPNGVCKLMDCLAVVLMDEFSNCLNIFCHFAGT
jgi:hypothetical protein